MLKLKGAVPAAVGWFLAFVVLAEWLLWLMPKPHRPLQYMIAGSAATAAALGMVFARVVRRGIQPGTQPSTPVSGRLVSHP